MALLTRKEKRKQHSNVVGKSCRKKRAKRGRCNWNSEAMQSNERKEGILSMCRKRYHIFCVGGRRAGKAYARRGVVAGKGGRGGEKQDFRRFKHFRGGKKALGVREKKDIALGNLGEEEGGLVK